MSDLIRYRFKTYSVDDPRPLVDMATIKMPWWCTGLSIGEKDSAIIVCYLPDDEDLYKYWDDAFDINKEYATEITYTDRFQKPEWCD